MLSDCLLCPFLLIITGGKPDKQAYVFLQARSSPFKESTGLEWTADEELGINCRHSERSLVMSLICVRPFLPINLSTLPGDSPAILSARTHTHTHARTQAHTHTHTHTHTLGVYAFLSIRKSIRRIHTHTHGYTQTCRHTPLMKATMLCMSK